MLSYQLIRSRRKTIALVITKEAQLEVRAPLHAPRSAIEAFLSQKERWIQDNLNRRRQELLDQASFSVGEGDCLWLLGKAYPVHLQAERRKPVFDGEAFLLPDQPFSENKPEIVHLYRQLATTIIDEKISFYSERVGACPSAVKIGKADTRWGSCSGKNSLNFTWKLILAPEEAVDYVIVHELCHILHHNHSPYFWREVQRVLPDYPKRQQLLKEVQQRLTTENW